MVEQPTVDGGASGLGLASIWESPTGPVTLDVWYPQPALGTVAPDVPGLDSAVGHDHLREVRTEIVRTTVADLGLPPVDAADAYLRLHLLSTRLRAPRSIDLTGVFGLLANVAWTSEGPVAVPMLASVRLRARQRGSRLTVHGVDKFPRMIDYVCPDGVRIADADRVRLGAHLAAGTTVMHEGFVNFNAGTLGACMVEGRISAGVIVGAGTDVGGGASIMGTLSGGGAEVITIGSDCLIGANAGVGISLGDRCIVEAGLYLTAGARVTLPDGRVMPARTLNGAPDLLYRRNSVTGTVEALARGGTWGGLNSDLHAT